MDIVLVILSKAERLLESQKIIVWIDERFGFVNEMGDEEVAQTGVVFQLAPRVDEQRETPDRNMAGFVFEIDHKQVGVGAPSVIGPRETPEQ
ncbi:hypothetical protein FM111_00175 [Brevundimonas diminuta 3F5N]|uniref:Uncharacterized protein n=1 Tax=Brevundimonas diminuta 3F5N TaxID=1255603 RepID=A0A1R4EPY4_BREDI|nr:hypothetical protein FM111_00175 [Brevundimonas diminuta 3F5N]